MVVISRGRLQDCYRLFAPSAVTVWPGSLAWALQSTARRATRTSAEPGIQAERPYLLGHFTEVRLLDGSQSACGSWVEPSPVSQVALRSVGAFMANGDSSWVPLVGVPSSPGHPVGVNPDLPGARHSARLGSGVFCKLHKPSGQMKQQGASAAAAIDRAGSLATTRSPPCAGAACC